MCGLRQGSSCGRGPTWCQVDTGPWFKDAPLLPHTALGRNPNSPLDPAHAASDFGLCSSSSRSGCACISFISQRSSLHPAVLAHPQCPPEGASSRFSQGWLPPISTTLASERLSPPPGLNRCPVSHPQVHYPLTLFLRVCIPLAA